MNGKADFLIALEQFHVDPVTAWWIVCDRCNDSELVFGTTAALDAAAWAHDHLHEHEDAK